MYIISFSFFFHSLCLHQGGYVFIGICLLACGINEKKTTELIFTKFDGKRARGSWKKPLDCGGNPDHLTVGRG